MNKSGNVAGRVELLVKRVHGGNVKAAAREIGIKQQTLALIVAGKVTPKTDTLRPIARFYRASLDWLVDGTGTEPRVLSAVEEDRFAFPPALRWFLMVVSLEVTPRVQEALFKLPEGFWHTIRAALPEMDTLPKARAQLRFGALKRAGEQHYESWIVWLQGLIKELGAERTRDMLEQSVEQIERRFVPASKGKKGK